MKHELGALLRPLRERQGVSVEKVAFKAGIAPSTLRRWEKGENQPCLNELEKILRVLNASPEQQFQAIALINAPRAVVYLREQSPQEEEYETWLPATGDLLRAMRHRRGYSLARVTQQLRISKGTISRWEQSKSIPPAEVLERLFTVLKAFPHEQAALRERRLILAPPLQDTAPDLTEWEARLHTVIDQHKTKERLLCDLPFLTLEAQIWPLAMRDDQARRQLAFAYTWHADILLCQGRNSEAKIYSGRALALTAQLGKPERFWLQAAAVHARACSNKVGCPKRGAEMLAEWRERAIRLKWTATLLRDTAEYAGLAGETEKALALVKESRLAVEAEKDDEEAMRLANIIQARILLKAGRASESFPFLAADDKISSPMQHAFEQLQWVQALMALGDRSGAREWIERFYRQIDEHTLEWMRPKGDAFARSL